MPGVSRKAICPRGSFRMPTMRLRVVCGLAETMETLWPRMRFSSVDLPALGRPTSATTPKCGLRADFSSATRLPLFFVLDGPLRIFRYAHAVDASPVSAVHDELIAVLLHHRAGFRDPSGRGK